MGDILIKWTINTIIDKQLYIYGNTCLLNFCNDSSVQKMVGKLETPTITFHIFAKTMHLKIYLSHAHR